MARPDPSDFDAFFSARYSGLVHTLYLVCGDWVRAEDAAQEAFLRAWKRWGHLDAEPVAWVRKVAWRICVDEWRSSRRYRAALDRLGSETRHQAPTPDSTSAFERVSSLPPALRTVLVLHYAEDLSVESISDLLACPVGTVKSRLSRARDALRAQYENAKGDERG